VKQIETKNIDDKIKYIVGSDTGYPCRGLQRDEESGYLQVR
jgi:hypothetical protein